MGDDAPRGGGGGAGRARPGPRPRAAAPGAGGRPHPRALAAARAGAGPCSGASSTRTRSSTSPATGRPTARRSAARCAATSGGGGGGWTSWARCRWRCSTAPPASTPPSTWPSRSRPAAGRAAGDRHRARPADERFNRLLALWAARRGWFRLAFLRLDGRPIAFQSGLQAHGVLYALKIGYAVDEAARRTRPARCWWRPRSSAPSRGPAPLRLRGQRGAWNRRLATGSRTLLELSAFPPTAAGWAADAAAAARRGRSRRPSAPGRLRAARNGVRGASAAAQPPAGREDRRGDGGPREAGPRQVQGVRAHALGGRGVVAPAPRSPRRARRAGGARQQPALPLDHLRQPPDARRDDRAPVRVRDLQRAARVALR